MEVNLCVKVHYRDFNFERRKSLTSGHRFHLFSRFLIKLLKSFITEHLAQRKNCMEREVVFSLLRLAREGTLETAYALINRESLCSFVCCQCL